MALLVRGESLAATMSRYLINELEALQNVVIRTSTRVVDGRGRRRSRGTTPCRRPTMSWEEAADALFLMTERTRWPTGCPRRSSEIHGFVLTGAEAVETSRERPPLMFETTVPGVFAVGDVRSGSVKLDASAVGEGSVS